MIKSFKKPCLSALLMFFTVASHADVSLTVGENVVVTRIDGQVISHGLLTAPKRKFVLENGVHEFSAKYKRLFELSADDHDMVRSVDLTLKADMADGTYQLQMLDQPDVHHKAVEYAEKPTLALLHRGKVITKKTAIVGSTTGMFEGISAGVSRVIPGSSANKPVAIKSSPKSVKPTTSDGVTNVNTSNTLDAFMRIWLDASPLERQKIKSWVKDQ